MKERMKAVVYERYGGPEVFRIEEIERPIPKEKEVLVQLHAVSLNASDFEMMRGSPVYTRMWGPFKPRKKILGSDIAGIVTEVGEQVTKFKVGDPVYGDILGHWGGFAEYACAPEKELDLKPGFLTHEEASAIPQAGCVGLQGIRDKGLVKKGQKILINGAGGGSGSFAVQLAKLYEAEITGVDNGEKLESIQSWGADHVIDYTQEDFTKNGSHYDLILDLVASHPILDYYRSLAPAGKYWVVGGPISYIFKTLVAGGLLSLLSPKKMKLLTVHPNKDLDHLTDLINHQKIKIVTDKTYTFEEIPEAMKYVEDGHAKGKVVINLLK